MSNGDLVWMEKHIHKPTMDKIRDIPARALYEFANISKDGVRNSST